MRKKVLLFLLLLMTLSIGKAYAYSVNDSVEVSAVSLSYFPSEAKVVGEGDVSVVQGDLKLRADKVIFFVDREEIFAKALPGNKVRISKGKRVIYGSEVYYNARKKEGFILNAEGEENGVRFYGKRVSFCLIDTIPSRSFLIFFKTKPVKLKKPDFEVSIREGGFTTCRLYNPTYFVSGRKIVIYPNGNVRIIRPALFIGGHKLLALPFDYSFNLRRKRGLIIIPAVGYTSTLGWYGGVYISSVEDLLSLSFAFLYSEEEGIVGKSKVEWRFSKDKLLVLGVERSEDWDGERMRWRGEASFYMNGGKYAFKLSYLRDRKYWVLRDDEDIKTVYSALPEAVLKYDLKPFTLFFRWGDYEEEAKKEEKVTCGVSLNLIQRLSKSLSLSLGAVYLKDFYEGDFEREIFYADGELSWRLSDSFTLIGGYRERKVFGETPFYFDRYEPLRKYVIGFKKTFGESHIDIFFSYDDLKDIWRDLKGKLSFNIGPRFYLSVEPWYYLNDSSWREVNYSLVYFLCPCGCMSLKVEFHDDLRKENDDSLWIRLYISSTSLSFGSGAFPEKDSLIPR